MDEPFITTAKGVIVSSAAPHARWVVMTSSAHSPPGVKRSRYRNVALVQRSAEYAADNRMPARINLHFKSIDAIQHYGAFHVGRTDAGAYQKAVAEAQLVAAKLNAAVTP